MSQARLLASKTKNGNKLVLKDIRRVSKMHLNLILVGKLDEVGMINQFGVDRWKLNQGSMIVACEKRKICKGGTNVAEDTFKELWPKRLGHVSEKGLKILAKDHLPNIKRNPLESCEDCLLGKQHRVSFKRPNYARRKKTYSRSCSFRVISKRSIDGAQYFVTFIDNHSRKVWEFHANVERGSKRKLKSLRTDNNEECIDQLEVYCKTHGTRHENATPNTFQINGVAKRMNITIVEKVRSILSQTKLPKSF
ncbi:hypothetical protein CR513_48732, partial [Mucuna pruriens]